VHFDVDVYFVGRGGCTGCVNPTGKFSRGKWGIHPPTNSRRCDARTVCVCEVTFTLSDGELDVDVDASCVAYVNERRT